MHNSELDPHHVPALDGLRGLAALMVLTFHVSLWIEGPVHFSGFRESIEHLSRGVQIFFILSAYTLTMTSKRRWMNANHPILAFYVRRAFRILPLWWLAILVERAVSPNVIPVSAALGSAFFYFGFSPQLFPLLIIPVGWSLFVEESFYVFFPLWRVLSRRPVFVGLCAILTGVVAFWIGRFGLPGMEDRQAIDFLVRSPLTNYYAFFIGIFLERTIGSSVSRWLLSDQSMPVFILNAMTPVSAILVFLGGRVAGTFFFLPLFFAALNGKALFGKVMRGQFITLCGRSCYSIYLFHSLIGSFVVYKARDLFWPPLHLEAWPVELKLAVLFVPIALSCLAFGLMSYRFVEFPCIKLGKIAAQRVSES